MTAAMTSETFYALYEQQADYVWSSLKRLGIPARDLEDAIQEVFLVVHRRSETLDASRPIRSWLFATAFRVASDYRRKASNQRERLDVTEEPVSIAPSAESEVLRAEGRALADRALMSLSDEQRAVFILHELEEQPMPLIAQTLEIPVNTAYSRLRLAREQFAAAARRIQMQGGAS